MVDRHAIQQMLGAGLTVGEVARHFGISVRTVRRIRKEPPIESASDTESRGRRRVGRPAVSEVVRDRMRALRLEDPVAPRLEVLRQLREEGVRPEVGAPLFLSLRTPAPRQSTVQGNRGR